MRQNTSLAIRFRNTVIHCCMMCLTALFKVGPLV